MDTTDAKPPETSPSNDVGCSDARDAQRYQFLKRSLRWGIGSYQSESGQLAEATASDWYLRSLSIFKVKTNRPPESFDAAIDAAILQGE